MVAFVKARATPKAYAFTKSEHLQSHCLKRKHCVLWLTAGERGQLELRVDAAKKEDLFYVREILETARDERPSTPLPMPR